ncbi:MAG TPA: four helix bundle protein [Phycisphaerales bacterium]|nr:four helix bundle protein [Phycisphaerales bacterium]
MSRLREELLDRVVVFGDRGLQLAEALDEQGVFRRVTDQMSGCFTSVGANTFEAHEAMSEKDFVKALGIAIKEASECRHWLRIAKRRRYFTEKRLASPEQEATELVKVLGAIIFRTKRKPKP